MKYTQQNDKNIYVSFVRINLEIRLWISKYIPIKRWNMITHPCPNLEIVIEAKN